MKKSKHFKLISLLISLVIIWIITVGCSANQNCNTSTTKDNSQNSATASNIQTNNQNSTNNTNTQENNYTNNKNTNKSNTSNKNNTNETTINNSKDNNTSAKDKKSYIKITIANKEFDLSVLLNPKDVQNLDNWQLSLLRNAYYAKHGYKFKMEKYSNYFSKYDWYIPKYDNVENFITDSDTKNINLLLELEKTFSQNCIDNIIINEKNNGENDTFYLGMKMEDALKKLKELKLDSKLKIMQTPEENLVCNCIDNHGDDGHPQTLLYIDTDSKGLGNPKDRIVFSLKFDIRNHRLINIDPPNIPTSLGLKMGDSLDDMKKLYGTNYTIYGNDTLFPEVSANNKIKYCKVGYIYEYKIDNHYFRVSILNNEVITWEISKFKIQKRIYLSDKTFCLCCTLKPEDLEGLDKNDLAILRNAYYAKHGYIFKIKKYNDYFSYNCQWYTPQYDNVDSLLTETDRKNIDLILKFEKALR
ncbi:hypothetical protein CLTEP_21450 [Clostridium tepidiprofundi DSM 19306]|uniref:YARHG domain-containing protein n=1 Tax=Clostridium tepidiprofundi DSM 19306 TaxID=1121338 RepID=A0A151B0W9_9CLOT|nr:YARHG domain-containing protein [Clostridium tepidiprofundi]KYH33287.1 hypothetical protein CLTEP_21450 [Clostridium tepidiprofundi DSM 19306]